MKLNPIVCDDALLIGYDYSKEDMTTLTIFSTDGNTLKALKMFQGDKAKLIYELLTTPDDEIQQITFIETAFGNPVHDGYEYKGYILGKEMT